MRLVEKDETLAIVMIVRKSLVVGERLVGERLIEREIRIKGLRFGVYTVSVRRIVLIVVGGIVVMICQGLRRWLFTGLL